jgi:hypothetical protein
VVEIVEKYSINLRYRQRKGLTADLRTRGGHRRNIGESAFDGAGGAQLDGIIGAVGEQNGARRQAVEQDVGTVPVIGLGLRSERG